MARKCPPPKNPPAAPSAGAAHEAVHESHDAKPSPRMKRVRRGQEDEADACNYQPPDVLPTATSDEIAQWEVDEQSTLSALPSEHGGRRPDVAQRITDNKNVDFFVCKQMLQAFVRPEGRGLALDECLLEMNQAVGDAYLLANLFALRQLERHLPLPKLDQLFFQTVLSLVTNKERRLPLEQQDLMDAANDFNTMRAGAQIANTKYINQGWFPSTAKQMATNVKNHVFMNFGRRMRTYIKDRYQLSKVNTHEAMDRIFDTEPFTLTFGRLADPAVAELRSKIVRTETGKISWAPKDLLPVLYEFLVWIEQWNAENRGEIGFVEKRRFCILPTKKGFTASHFKIDSTAFRSLLLRSPAVSRDLVIDHDGEIWTLEQSLKRSAPWNEMAGAWWRVFFRIEKVEKRVSGCFHHQITTDGFSVSVHMTRPTRGKPKQRKVRNKTSEGSPNESDVYGIPLSKSPKGWIDDYDVVWGVDPGRTDFISAVSLDGRRLRFRTSDFRRASGYNRSNRKSKNRIDRNPHIRELLRATPSKKTASSVSFRVSVEFWLANARELLLYFMDPLFRKLRFQIFSLSNAQLDRTCSKLAGRRGTRTLIGFGDRGMAGNGFIKGCVAGPVTRFVRKLARYCEVVVVDEFRTSKVHYDCNSRDDLVNQRILRKCRDGIVRTVPVHKVQHCVGCGLTVDRHVNAAKNILNVVECQLLGIHGRPSRLKRN